MIFIIPLESFLVGRARPKKQGTTRSCILLGTVAMGAHYLGVWINPQNSLFSKYRIHLFLRR